MRHFAAFALLLPSLAMAQDADWDMGTVKKEIESLKSRVAALEAKWDMGTGKTCPCPTGGKCICPADNCPCELCLEHLTPAKAAQIYAKHEAEISKIWEAMGDSDESATMKKAVEVWIKQQIARNQGVESAATPPLRVAYERDVLALGKLRDKLKADGEDAESIARTLHAARREIGEKYKNLTPEDLREKIYERNQSVYGDPLGPSIDWLRNQGKSWEQIAESASDPGDWPPKGLEATYGVELLGFYSDSCIHCPGAKADTAGLDIEWIDADTDPRAKQYNVTALPALVRIINGHKQGHFEGRTGLATQAKTWLKNVSDPPDEPSKALSEADSLRYHLRTEHGYGPSKLAGMSDAEVKAAHDRLHAAPKVTTAPKRVIVSSAPRYSAPAYSSRSVVRYGGSTWTWPGNLRQHLETTHGVSTAGLSDSELRTVHDNLHNTGRSGITGGSSYSAPRPVVQYAQRSYQPRVYYSSGYSSGCPNGMCPR